MSPSSLQHRRTHNLLLISKLLNQRDATSPFTLVLDSLEQSGRPLVEEFARRAIATKTKIILVSFETLKKPTDVDAFIRAWESDGTSWQKELLSHVKTEPTQRKLIIFDSLSTLAATEGNLPGTLSSFISPTTSILATYHLDIPTSEQPNSTHTNAYAPGPLALLKYIATTIFTTHCLHHVLARKAARDRSHVEPSFGLEEGVEGLVQGLGANGTEGVVIEMEHRRKSGRGVGEWYFLPLNAASSASTPISATAAGREKMMLLEDHPQYRPQHGPLDGGNSKDESTFELGLTEKQRRDREGVVLPYFDAQQDGGDGGRILYDMGSEDDFDEEEDEI